jgi:hypothetical protein
MGGRRRGAAPDGIDDDMTELGNMGYAAFLAA